MSNDVLENITFVEQEQVTPANETGDDVYVLPMSFGQQRLWFLDQFEPDSPFYNIPTGVRFKGRLHKRALEDAISEVIRRHETLRTTFERVDNEPCQIIHPFKRRLFPEIDISDLPPEQHEARIQTLARREAATPFNLRTGPLLRVTFIKAAENDTVILITMHHIISDGWSMGVFVREITQLYQAFANGKPSPLLPLTIQYGDFAEWQQQHIAGAVLDKQLDYWKSQLGGSLPVLELPGDRPRPTVQTMVGASANLTIPIKISAAFKEMSRRAGVTLYMSLLAAFKILLHKYTGLEDIIVGSPIANRNRAEIEPLIGFFVNTLVLRSDLSGDPTFGDLLLAVKKNTLAAYDNQDVPFERLVEVLQPQRDMAHSPLFQVMFILQNNPVRTDGDFGEVAIQQLDVEAGTSTYDLTLMVSETPVGFFLSAEYNTDIYDAATMERLLVHYQNLLAALVANPQARLPQLTFLPEEEKEQLLRTWNNFERDFRFACVHELFEKQAAKTPEATAVVFEKTSLTYRELNRRANQLAHYLKRFGVGPDVKVSLCLDKSLDLPVAVLGVLKAGGAYVPVDPTYPQDRIDYMLTDSGAAVVITQKKYAALVPAKKFNVLFVDADWPEIAEMSDDNPGDYPDIDNLAYMIYTSGSTGAAKGTMVSHKSIVNAYFAWEEDYGLRAGANSHLQMASFSFDVFGGDFVRALLSGGKLVLAPRELLLEAGRLYELMRRERVNCAEFVPAVLRNLIHYLEETGGKLDFMRNLIAGSDIWTVKEYKKFLAFCGPNTRLINSFGLTEAAVDSTFFEGDVADYAEERIVPIGRPFPNNKIYILDPWLNPMPIGVPGELVVAGPNLARGYFHQPELTAEKFVPNPFSETGERLYRTGDLARWLADGNIEFLGRIDHQIKIRGFRVELGEIETVLEKHPGVKNAVVIAREDKPGDVRLVGYVTARNNANPDSAALRAFLKEQVPDYMVPSAFMVLAELPLTPNGKVDRKALPAPDAAAYAAGQSYVEPATQTEQKLAGIWASVLRVEKIGAEDNFFELGGHSLLATQVVSRIREVFQVELPLRNLFEFVTVSELAAAIDHVASQPRADVPPISPLPAEAEPVLSFAQERLWFLDQLEPDSPFYNIPEAVRIRGPLDVAVLQRCLSLVVLRHDSLRTTFHNRDGKPVLKILPQVEIRLATTDLSDLAPDQREAEALRLTAEEAQQPFDLTQAPLFRVRLLVMGGQDFLLLYTMHHIISDGWSSNILVGEIAVLYDNGGRDVSCLPPLPLQYQDYAWWQRQWLKDKILAKELDYWTQVLRGAPPLLNLPTDRPRPAVQTPNGDFASFELSPELTRALNALSQAKGVTLFMTLLAAFYTLLYRYSGQEDINIGTPVANRTRGELESIIGFFVNTLVLRADLAGAPAFDELLLRVKTAALGAFAHQDVPFEKIVDALKVERNLSHSPLFQVMFALQNTPAQNIETETRLSISPVTAHSGTSKFDLTLFMVEEGDALSGGFEYNTDLFDATTIARMMAHYTKLLGEIVNDSSRSIAALPMISAEERAKILYEWNGQPAPLAFSGTIVDIFRQTVQNFPDHIALEYENERLTYLELNARANALAFFLVNKGVKPDVLVGLSVPRSIDLVVAILGILKAGGAYVPLDPGYPAERLAYMLADCGAPVILTTSAVAKILPATQAELVCLDTDWGEIATSPKSNPAVVRERDNLAYMIYTSGSTGKPKGALITHHGLTNYLDWTARAYPLEQGRGSVVHSTIAFDATVTAVFTPLLTGKTITLVPDGADLDALAATLCRHTDFNVVKITPAHLEMLGHQVPPEQARSLTASFVIGGENLTAEQIDFWQKYAPDTLLFNEYGPTETVVGCVVYEARQWRGAGSVPIGTAITNAVVYVLDQNFEPVPPGVPGELYIGGEGVARGYHNRPDLTAERFVPNPFSEKPGERLYKTGDLVRYQNDGTLIFLDRIDNQVKIRGYRIELGEIDAVLQQSPQVETAMTLVREDRPGDKRLVAYFVQKGGNDITAALRDLTASQLPDYMRPAAFVRLAEFPLTANGKVDRRTLPSPDYADFASGAEFVAPRNDDEQALAEIWEKLLHLERLGVYDDFFDIGGHSLLATQLMSRIRETFGLELPLRLLFEAPTVAGLIKRIDEARQETNQIVAPPLTPAKRESHIPLSFAQQRLWFLDQLAPGNPFYNIPVAIKLTGALDVPAFTRAVQEVVHRHESLRTIFVEEQGVPQQIILPDLTVSLPVVDISYLSENEKEAEITRLVNENAATIFALDKGPLFKPGLIRRSETEHIILFTVHHIISDGWSTEIMLREIGALYEAFRHNAESPLPPLEIQYADFAVWQRDWLRDDILKRQLDFWRQAIGEKPPILNLPVDFPRPPLPSFRGDVVATKTSAEILTGLQQLSREQGVTVFMTLLAALQTLLHRYSHQDEILVGSPIANRNYGATENLIGFFVNTLVYKSNFTPVLTFVDLLQNIRDFSLAAYAHQDVPFEQLVDLLEPDRDTSRSPLFQVMLVLQNRRGGESTQLPSLALETLEPETRAAKFDLTVVMAEQPDGFAIEFEYNTDIFARATIERMLQHFLNLLNAIVANPNRRTTDLPLISADEQETILRRWNNTAIDFPADKCIHELFEAQVAATPDAVAVVDENERLTFSELNASANRLAAWLRRQDVGPETLVGIAVEKSAAMVIGLLAILKAGGVYVPIDPNYPLERIDYIFADAGMNILLTQAEIAGRFVAFRRDVVVDVVVLDGPDQPFLSESSDNLLNVCAPENLAYVIYTSGSTGRPKGTMLAHRGLVNLTLEVIKQFELNPASRTLQFASFSFDASIEEIFSALLSGSALYLARKENIMPGPDLFRYLAEKAITKITLTPTALAALPADGLALKTVVSAGEACTREIVEKWAPGRRFLNGYGPTETTVAASYYCAADVAAKTTIPIGTPIGNVTLYVLDENFNLAPTGVPGELCIGGVGLARGYLNRPDLTADKFVPNPFSETGDRLYRSGDLARFLPDGNLEFVGRIGHQVKLRGFRIELGEIEAILAQHPAVLEAVVIARQDDGGGENRLLAYVVNQPGETVVSTDLRVYLRERLPDYMIPAAYILLEKIPLTPNGKIDHKALPAPDKNQIQPENAYVPPRTAEEKIIAGIWEQVLRIERAGASDNFFDLGGHSLLATQVISRVKEAFNIDVPLVALFENPTIAGLAQQVTELVRAGHGLILPPLRPAPRDQVLPLSFAQQRLWFLDQLEPGSPLYNLPAAVRLTGSLDIELLQKSIEHVVRQHEILRTTFVAENGKARQVINPAAVVELPVDDLRAFSDSERNAEINRLIAAEALAPFDLANGPLLRLRLLHVAEDEAVFLLTMHHIVSDGWSMGIFVREVAGTYHALLRGEQPEWPALEIQYADYAAWQRGWLQGEALATQLAYWKQQLAGIPELIALPTDRPRPAVQSFRGKTQSFAIAEAPSRALTELTRQEGVTLFMALLAVFQTLLYRYSCQEDICIGTPIANRHHLDLEPLIGFFVNTLVLRGDFSQPLTFRELLRQVRRTALEAYAHQDLPFETLVDAIKPARDMSHSPLFQVVFTLQKTPQTSAQETGLRIIPAEFDSGLAKFDLTMTMMESGEELAGSLEYNTDLFDDRTIERMIGHFIQLLNGLVAEPDRLIADVSILPAHEESLLLKKWNDTAVDFPAQFCAHELFEAQAEKYPDAVAVTLAGDSLTYRELNERANRLARRLRKLGIGPEAKVGILVERSLNMIAGLLGVLKAGGAYVPLDPTYPQERLSFMLNDAAVSVLLTQAGLLEELEIPLADLAGLPVLRLDAEWQDINCESGENLENVTAPENLAYIIYTSGSTGRPKGTLLQHRGLVNFITAYNRDLDIKPGSRVLQFFSFGFDGSVADIFSALLAGATLHLVRRDDVVSAVDLYNVFKDQAITHSLITPSMLQVLPNENLPALQYLLAGGERCTEQIVERWAPGRHFYNAYGPTEATVAVSWCRVEVTPDNRANIPIGRPIANTQLYILDKQLCSVPIGVAGELHVGGEGLARGYLNRPDLTAEKFIPDPFSDQPGARLYKTGDLARYLPDGTIEHLGRIDSQVKVRGFRIELEEIETVLGQAPDVRECAVIIREDRPGDKRIVAYYAPAAGAEVIESGLRDFVRSRLPEYMRPAAFVRLEALPVNENGKVNRRALPAPDQSGPDREAAYVAPRTPVEEKLAEIWRQVLGLQKVGAADNFFDLGGDSILTMQVVALANQAGIRISPRLIFQHPTIAELAAAAAAEEMVQAEQGLVTGTVSLTPVQHWFFEHQKIDPHHFNTSMMLEFFIRPEIPLLEAAMNHLLRHHDALRLQFRRVETGWEGFLGESGNVTIQRFAFSHKNKKETKSAIESAATVLQASLDLAEPPLLRLAFFDLGANENPRLLIIFHHLIIDGVSWRLFIQDFLRGYQQLSRGEEIRLPAKTTSYQVWANRLREHAQSATIREQLRYWQENGAFQPAPLPRDFAGANTFGSAADVTLSLDAGETRRLLQGVLKTQETGINAVLLTVLGRVLGQWTGESSFLIEMEGHGREDLFADIDLSRTIGWFTTIFPVLIKLKGNDLAGQLAAVAEQVQNIPQHGFGFGLLRYLSDEPAVKEQLASLPEPQVNFNYLGQFDQFGEEDQTPFQMAPESVGLEQSASAMRSALLYIVGIVNGGQLHVRWLYSKNVHKRATIEKLAKSYMKELRKLIARFSQ